ncbi:MAG: hypothetical protein M3Y64_04295 [Gemmatimonadota bacterium]|nr:hypothetical protein [Gemmatimonadota bacterium]
MLSVSGDNMIAALPTHRQLIANMIAKMNAEMRDMKMTADGEWSATVDSLRNDLIHMPELSSAELSGMMRMHLERVRRLNAMHARMMGSMKR